MPPTENDSKVKWPERPTRRTGARSYCSDQRHFPPSLGSRATMFSAFSNSVPFNKHNRFDLEMIAADRCTVLLEKHKSIFSAREIDQIFATLREGVITIAIFEKIEAILEMQFSASNSVEVASPPLSEVVLGGSPAVGSPLSAASTSANGLSAEDEAKKTQLVCFLRAISYFQGQAIDVDLLERVFSWRKQLGDMEVKLLIDQFPTRDCLAGIIREISDGASVTAIMRALYHCLFDRISSSLSCLSEEARRMLDLVRDEVTQLKISEELIRLSVELQTDHIVRKIVYILKGDNGNEQKKAEETVRFLFALNCFQGFSLTEREVDILFEKRNFFRKGQGGAGYICGCLAEFPVYVKQERLFSTSLFSMIQALRGDVDFTQLVQFVRMLHKFKDFNFSDVRLFNCLNRNRGVFLELFGLNGNIALGRLSQEAVEKNAYGNWCSDSLESQRGDCRDYFFVETMVFLHQNQHFTRSNTHQAYVDFFAAINTYNAERIIVGQKIQALPMELKVYSFSRLLEIYHQVRGPEGVHAVASIVLLLRCCHRAVLKSENVNGHIHVSIDEEKVNILIEKSQFFRSESVRAHLREEDLALVLARVNELHFAARVFQNACVVNNEANAIQLLKFIAMLRRFESFNLSDGAVFATLFSDRQVFLDIFNLQPRDGQVVVELHVKTKRLIDVFEISMGLCEGIAGAELLLAIVTQYNCIAANASMTDKYCALTATVNRYRRQKLKLDTSFDEKLLRLFLRLPEDVCKIPLVKKLQKIAYDSSRNAVENFEEVENVVALLNLLSSEPLQGFNFADKKIMDFLMENRRIFCELFSLRSGQSNEFVELIERIAPADRNLDVLRMVENAYMESRGNRQNTYKAVLCGVEEYEQERGSMVARVTM